MSLIAPHGTKYGNPGSKNDRVTTDLDLEPLRTFNSPASLLLDLGSVSL